MIAAQTSSAKVIQGLPSVLSTPDCDSRGSGRRVLLPWFSPGEPSPGGPRGPAGPGGPGGPIDPGGPGSPFSPFSPDCPLTPRSPCSPGLPGGPGSPTVPGTPLTPGGPEGPIGPGGPCSPGGPGAPVGGSVEVVGGSVTGAVTGMKTSFRHGGLGSPASYRDWFVSTYVTTEKSYGKGIVSKVTGSPTGLGTDRLVS